MTTQFRQEYLDTLYRYAKFQYECGNYSGAAEYLYFFRVLVSVVVCVCETSNLLYSMFRLLWFVKCEMESVITARGSVVGGKIRLKSRNIYK